MTKRVLDPSQVQVPPPPPAVREFEEENTKAGVLSPRRGSPGSYREAAAFLCQEIGLRTRQDQGIEPLYAYLEALGAWADSPRVEAFPEITPEISKLVEQLHPSLRPTIRDWLAGLRGRQPNRPEPSPHGVAEPEGQWIVPSAASIPQVPPPQPTKNARLPFADALAVDPMSISEEQREAAHGRSSYVPPSRAGKKQLMGYFDEEIIKALRVLALRQDTTMKALLEEAVHDVLAKHHVDPTKIQQLLEGRNPN